ncbi:hypothetical protein RclHR1_00900009 [Rhizophagus clarus]|uniref:Protein kinase domain-containing protein n=1 Tax=Rhizophagus clarus TaxID=94130 RepID=A0A2Z6S923_9GLOM|nr:hypothetical protein RclHR1_00900009 [Rhizophagus clarus]
MEKESVKDLHNGNILRSAARYFLTGFGLSGTSNISSEKIYVILGYVAPEVWKDNDDDAKKIKAEFLITNKEIPNVQSSFKRNPNFNHVSKLIDFGGIIKNSASHDLDSSLIELKLSDDISEGNDESIKPFYITTYKIEYNKKSM